MCEYANEFTIVVHIACLPENKFLEFTFSTDKNKDEVKRDIQMYVREYLKKIPSCNSSVRSMLVIGELLCKFNGKVLDKFVGTVDLVLKRSGTLIDPSLPKVYRCGYCDEVLVVRDIDLGSNPYSVPFLVRITSTKKARIGSIDLRLENSTLEVVCPYCHNSLVSVGVSNLETDKVTLDQMYLAVENLDYVDTRHFVSTLKTWED